MLEVGLTQTPPSVDHSAVDAQVQTTCARHPARPADGPVSDPLSACWRGAQLLLPGNWVHHSDSLPEPAGNPQETFGPGVTLSDLQGTACSSGCLTSGVNHEAASLQCPFCQRKAEQRLPALFISKRIIIETPSRAHSPLKREITHSKLQSSLPTRLLDMKAAGRRCPWGRWGEECRFPPPCWPSVFLPLDHKTEDRQEPLRQGLQRSRKEQVKKKTH